MNADLKQLFLFILGIIIAILIYRIMYFKIYGVEGFWNPLEGIIDIVNTIVNGVLEIIDFICYLGYVMIWVFQTVGCIFAVFSPLYCPIIRIVDMLIAFIGFIIASVLRIFGLGIVVTAFNNGVAAISKISKTYKGVDITDWHGMLGIDKKCYWCKFKPFPQRNKK